MQTSALVLGCEYCQNIAKSAGGGLKGCGDKAAGSFGRDLGRIWGIEDLKHSDLLRSCLETMTRHSENDGYFGKRKAQFCGVDGTFDFLENAAFLGNRSFHGITANCRICPFYSFTGTNLRLIKVCRFYFAQILPKGVEEGGGTI